MITLTVSIRYVSDLPVTVKVLIKALNGTISVNCRMNDQDTVGPDY